MDGTIALPEFKKNIKWLLHEGEKADEFMHDFNYTIRSCKDIPGIRDKYVKWAMADISQHGSVKSKTVIGELLRAGYPDIPSSKKGHSRHDYSLGNRLIDSADDAWREFKDENEGPDSNVVLNHGHTPQYYAARLIHEACPKEGYRGIIPGFHAAVYGAVAYRDAYGPNKRKERDAAMYLAGVRSAAKLLELASEET